MPIPKDYLYYAFWGCCVCAALFLGGRVLYLLTAILHELRK